VGSGGRGSPRPLTADTWAASPNGIGRGRIPLAECLLHSTPYEPSGSHRAVRLCLRPSVRHQPPLWQVTPERARRAPGRSAIRPSPPDGHAPEPCAVARSPRSAQDADATTWQRLPEGGQGHGASQAPLVPAGSLIHASGGGQDRARAVERVDARLDAARTRQLPCRARPLESPPFRSRALHNQPGHRPSEADGQGGTHLAALPTPSQPPRRAPLRVSTRTRAAVDLLSTARNVLGTRIEGRTAHHLRFTVDAPPLRRLTTGGEGTSKAALRALEDAPRGQPTRPWTTCRSRSGRGQGCP